MVKTFILAVFLLAGCSIANADTVPETYSVYIYISPTNFAYVTYTDPNGFIDADLYVPCSELAGFRFVYRGRQAACYPWVYFAPTEGGLSVDIQSTREGIGGGFFVPPDTDGKFVISPNSRSYLTITDPPETVSTPEPPILSLVLVCAASVLLVAKMTVR